MPKSLVKDDASRTDTYAKFIAEPFEAGYGNTVGNSLRRVLLSSLEGAAITSVKIAGAQHEFQTLPHVVDDVTDIVLNLKKVKFKANDHEIRNLTLSVNKEGPVTAGDIEDSAQCEVLNKDQLICVLDKKTKFEAELEVKVGRGFATGDENKHPDQPIGVIAIDSIFSPVTRVNGVLLADGDQFLRQRAQRLGFGERGLDAIVLDQADGKVGEQRFAVPFLAAEFDRLSLMTHFFGFFLAMAMRGRLSRRDWFRRRSARRGRLRTSCRATGRVA